MQITGDMIGDMWRGRGRSHPTHTNTYGTWKKPVDNITLVCFVQEHVYVRHYFHYDNPTLHIRRFDV